MSTTATSRLHGSYLKRYAHPHHAVDAPRQDGSHSASAWPGHPGRQARPAHHTGQSGRALQSYRRHSAPGWPTAWSASTTTWRSPVSTRTTGLPDTGRWMACTSFLALSRSPACCRARCSALRRRLAAVAESQSARPCGSRGPSSARHEAGSGSGRRWLRPCRSRRVPESCVGTRTPARSPAVSTSGRLHGATRAPA